MPAQPVDDNKRTFLLSLRAAAAHLIGQYEDRLGIPHDQSILAKRRAKARKMAVIDKR